MSAPKGPWQRSPEFPTCQLQPAQATAFVEAWVDQAGLPATRKLGLLVALEEAFVKICHYGYTDGT